ncbi:hypothetical protein B9Z19DRAFT_1125351 [Tuber borchii]|uniref:Uncharacterized protein n=1 Tax=Tuber borchii TaxID=42251 RepID=A0A2T6ZV36_TUBBO|nr:hypothetical protein B9Z19DRAFT_1125351 [Tuber borchii]
MPPPFEGQGLIAVRRTVYAAPGGNYASMEFSHAEGCCNTAPHHDAVVRDLVARIGLYDFSLVEASANAVLLTRGCLPECRFNRESTMGLYVHTADDGSQYVPPSSTPNPSQLTSSGDALDPVASDALVPSSSWPVLTAPTPPSPSPSPVRVVPALPTQSSSSSTYYGSTPSSSLLHALSSGERRLYGPNFRLDASSDVTYRPTDVSSPPHDGVTGFGGSGFDQSSPALPIDQRVSAPVPVSRRGVRFVGANETHPHTPSPAVSSLGVVARDDTPLVRCSQSVVDAPMSLGEGKNSNATGLGDSMHAVPESSLPSSIARLPPTASDTTTNMWEALDDIREGRCSPMSQSSIETDSSCDDIPTAQFRFLGADRYSNLDGVADDVRALGNGHNDLLEVVSRMAKHITTLERLTQRLVRRVNALEDNEDHAKFSPCPVATNTPAVVVPVTVPNTDGVAATAARPNPPPPPPVPNASRPTNSGPAACVPSSWVEVARRGAKQPARREQQQQPQQRQRPKQVQPSVSPNPITARDRHVTMRFATRKSIALPHGCSAESIRARLNAFFANGTKIRGSHPYVREARLRADIGSIYMTLAEHSSEEIGGMLERAHAILMREFSLPDFSFARDTKKLDILVASVPLADTGHGSVWRLEDWTNDRVYDGLRTDLERSNPGLITAGRPNIIGSLHAMRASNSTNCAIKFTVEKSSESDAVLRSARVCLRGGNRTVRLWTRFAPAKVSNNCLTLGHISTLCALPPRCRFCRGNHASRSHVCTTRNCDSVTGDACQHTVRLCLLCESSGHYTGFPQCPSLKMTPDGSPPPLGGSPIVEASDSISGAADRSRNRENRKRQRRRRPTPVGERQINDSVEAKDAAAGDNASNKGKSRAWEITDEEADGFADGSWDPPGVDITTAGAAPRSIIERPASAPIEGPTSGLTG